ncbi:MAG TPA: 4Fe-4S dicluster domain-containing protein [Phycisphaerae bacterium]|nr:4Fe-4S dicluster domain-containing protein [Phycisphaerae bacterium]
MADKHIEDLPPQDRRGFFAASLARLLGPVADYLEKKLPLGLMVMRIRPRPPGAIPEKEFLETCYRCGTCADACPANAIVMMRDEPDDDGGGTPNIDPNRQACVICEELICMRGCPSGALRPVDRFAIRMGLAVVDYGLCLRSKGQSCTKCITHCPLGDVAIRLDDTGCVRVIDPAATGRGCVGCGLCQQHCPTIAKRAIRVGAL